MVSTPEYYKVCADVIRDTAEVFGTPRYFHLGFDEETVGFSRNRNEAEGWATLEKSGAVFLPAAGTRIGTQCYDCGAGGRYWSGKVGLGGMAYGIGFSDKMIDGKLQEDAKEGLSVRLVKSAN